MELWRSLYAALPLPDARRDRLLPVRYLRCPQPVARTHSRTACLIPPPPPVVVSKITLRQGTASANWFLAASSPAIRTQSPCKPVEGSRQYSHESHRRQLVERRPEAPRAGRIHH